jgi:hypothetical protein
MLVTLLMIFAAATGVKADSEAALSVKLTLDAVSYAVGNTVKFKAFVTKNGMAVVGTEKRELKIKDPSGRDLVEASFSNLGGGNYGYNYYIQPSAKLGNYTVRALFKDRDGATGAAAITFMVAKLVPPPDTTAPVASIAPASGTFSAAFQVTLSSNEPGSIYYTINGTTPTLASSRYSAPISLSGTTTVKCFAVDAAGNASAVTTAVYTKLPPPPADTTAPITTPMPAPGTFNAPQIVTLAVNEAATIFYTTNGATPTVASSAYLSPLAVSATTVLKYFARDAAGNSEVVKTATYTITAVTTKIHDPLNTAVTWSGYAACSTCHAKQANDVYQSVHYQWKGQASHMTTGPATQGKLAALDGSSAINAYCINVLGNWNSCSTCHNGTGALPVATPAPSAAQLAAVDCLTCHKNPAIATPYARVRNPVTGLFEPKAGVDMNQVLRTVAMPTRSNCLECHAKAGGGDAVKRGDLALASGTTTDSAYDVHMSKTGGDLSCQTCHATMDHKMPGHGSDLRTSDSTALLSCSTTACHASQASVSSGHANKDIARHVGRVACQTCHIDTYAKNASDTAATEATETHRDWRVSEWNAVLNRYEPLPTKANNLTPKYAFWNGKAWGSNLNDVAVLDAATGAYKISRPVGLITDPTGTKLYPFKYKTSDQPLDTVNGKLIGLNTATYFATGNYQQAVLDGLVNQGLGGDAWTTVKADEYLVLNHQVAPAAGNALSCADCHKSTSRMNLPALGYAPKAANGTLCKQCHELKSSSDWKWTHDYHVTSKKYDCSWCHTFSRKAERGLR